MADEEFLLQLPQIREPLVPQLQLSVRLEGSERFEEAVEGRGAGAEQLVARRRHGELFGAVLRDHHQPAVGHRLGDDAQMHRAGQRPVVLYRLVGGKPLLDLASPRGIVAHLGHLALLPRAVEHPAEMGRIGNEVRRYGQHALERLIGEDHFVLRVELGDADRKLVQHGTLRFAEGAESAGLLLHFLDVYGIAGHAVAADRQVAHLHRATLAVDRGADDPFRRRIRFARQSCDFGRSSPFRGFDQLDLVFHHAGGIGRADGIDIGGIDEP